MAIFPLMYKIEYMYKHADYIIYIHLALKNHDERIKYWPYMQFRVTS